VTGQLLQHSTVNLLVKVQYIWKYGCITTPTCSHIKLKHSEYFLVSLLIK
jgi:hypothetical protein